MRTATAAALLILAVVPVIGSPTTPEALERLTEQASPQAALDQVEAFLAANPDDYDGLLLKGYLLSQLGRREGAEKVYRNLVRQRPGNPEAYNNLAVLYAAAGHYEKAAEALKQALGTHPSYSVAYENLGRVYGRSASEAYSRALGVEAPKETDAEELVPLRRSAGGSNGQVSPQLPGQVPSQVTSEARGEAAEGRRQPLPSSTLPTRQNPSKQTSPGGTAGARPPRPVTPSVTSPASAPGPSPSDLRQEVESMVRTWARAWSEQRADEYLAFYSTGFRPPEGLDRSSWEEVRRSRLQKPNTIRVVVRDLQPPVTTARGTAVTFVQSYSSDHFADRVTKTLVLVREGGRWKILEERAEP